MTGYLDLPVGKLRYLGKADIESRTVLPAGTQFLFDSLQDNFSTIGTFGATESVSGIQAGINNVAGRTYGELWGFIPPKDRGWLLALVGIDILQSSGVAPGFLFGDLQVDGPSLVPQPTNLITSPGQTFLAFGLSPSGAPPGSSFPTYPVLPINIDPNFFLPIRNNMNIVLQGTTQGGAGQASLLVAILVWEYYLTAPLKPDPNPFPAQPVNESWQ